jgi:hypothetical protein
MAARTNEIIGIAFAENLYGYTDEPVTLQEVKDYAKIDFDDDDVLLEQLIVASRIQLETLTGLSFVPKDITVQLKNQCSGIEIPYGPIEGDLDPTLITDRDGNVIEIETEGLGGFLSIRTCLDFVQIIYSAGYVGTLPEDLKTALKGQVFFLYQNRGERLSFGVEGVRSYSVSYVCDFSQQMCARYRRVWDATI